mmetsp:Transcript_23437/g.29391  ORF Transcript_23437/g.29391 Transcript_23437/m.29391 type:complete len:202 (-) Transcript_23437:334-939(-)
MGSSSSKSLNDSRPSNINIQDPTTWSLDHVRELHQRYRDENYDFGLEKMVFTELCMETFPEASDLPEMLWEKFVLNGEEVIHTLQVFCGLASVCHGLTSEKITFLFDVFDFNNTTELNYDELFILIFTTLSGIVRMVGTGNTPEERPIEKIVDDIFVAAGKDSSTKVTKHEFQSFTDDPLQLTREDMSTLDVLKKFDLLDG